MPYDAYGQEQSVMVYIVCKSNSDRYHYYEPDYVAAFFNEREADTYAEALEGYHTVVGVPIAPQVTKADKQ